MKTTNAETNLRIGGDTSDAIKKTQSSTQILWAVCRRVCVSAGLVAVVGGALGVDLSAAEALGAREEGRVVAGERLNQKTPTPTGLYMPSDPSITDEPDGVGGDGRRRVGGGGSGGAREEGRVVAGERLNQKTPTPTGLYMPSDPSITDDTCGPGGDGRGTPRPWWCGR